MRLLVIAFAAAVIGCGPTRPDTVEAVDAALARGAYATVCLGLQAADDEVRAHAASRLAKYPGEEEAAGCLCDAVYDAERGRVDPVIARALRHSRHEGATACLAEAVADERVRDKGVLIAALGDTLAAPAWPALAQVARTSAEPAVRAAAVAALQSSPDHGDVLQLLVRNDPDPTVRAAAVRALHNRRDDGNRPVLLGALKDDADASVRIAAAEVLDEDDHVHATDALCEALMGDPDPGVRAAAIGSFAGTKRAREARCLVRRMKAREDDGAVREALLAALRTSPAAEVREALCSQIGPWLRMYVTDEIADRVPGHAILDAQNHNHWEDSLRCAERAMAQGGYSCYARNHLAHWVNELGGKAKAPWCPGMSRGE